MIRVGVTGGIGSGKSLVCSILTAMGYPVFNADKEAHLAVEQDAQAIEAIKSLFGDNIYIDKRLNRKKLGEIVFTYPDLLSKLNGIVHPLVIERFVKWVDVNRKRPVVFMEAAILFESGADKGVDKTVSVVAPVDVRIDRIIARDGLSKDLILNRMNNQFAQEELIKRSNYIIENDGVKLLLPQVIKIVNELVKV